MSKLHAFGKGLLEGVMVAGTALSLSWYVGLFHSKLDVVPFTPLGAVGQWAADCESPCHLPDEFMKGGLTHEFLSAAFIITQSGKQLIIDNQMCMSACTILVDEIQYQNGDVCVDVNTIMGFHMGTIKYTDGRPDELYRYTYRNNLQEFIFEQGVLPDDGTFFSTPAGSLGAHYPVCNFNKTAPGLHW